MSTAQSKAAALMKWAIQHQTDGSLSLLEAGQAEACLAKVYQCTDSIDKFTSFMEAAAKAKPTTNTLKNHQALALWDTLQKSKDLAVTFLADIDQSLADDITSSLEGVSAKMSTPDEWSTFMVMNPDEDKINVSYLSDEAVASNEARATAVSDFEAVKSFADEYERHRPSSVKDPSAWKKLLDNLDKSATECKKFICVGSCWHLMLDRGVTVDKPRARTQMVIEHKKRVNKDLEAASMPASVWDYMDVWARVGKWYEGDAH